MDLYLSFRSIMATNSVGTSTLNSLILSVWGVASFVLASQVAQDDFVGIAIWACLAFGAYYFVITQCATLGLRKILIAAVVTRFVLVFFTPQLSDDVYRFIWDGRLWHMGIHPFSATPRELIATNLDLSLELFDKLNSPDYRTIYPPIAQLSNYLAAFLQDNTFRPTIICMKLFLLIAELVSLWAIVRIFRHYLSQTQRVALYALNPLVLVEIMGNMHHEGFMICFVLLCILALKSKSYIWAGVALGLGIASKLLPLLFMPVIFLFIIEWGDRVRFLSACLTTCLLSFGCLLLHLENPLFLFESLQLYLRKFEFNASLYYIFREIGYWVKGYNLIHLIGPLSALLLTVWTIWLSVRQRLVVWTELVSVIVVIFLGFLLLSATVHPWYILLPIALSTMTPIRSFFLWSSLIMLSYSAYSYNPFNENPYLLLLQYSLVFGSLYLERRHLILN